jgi:hypothetical protein
LPSFASSFAKRERKKNVGKYSYKTPLVRGLAGSTPQKAAMLAMAEDEMHEQEEIAILERDLPARAKNFEESRAPKRGSLLAQPRLSRFFSRKLGGRRKRENFGESWGVASAAGASEAIWRLR